MRAKSVEDCRQRVPNPTERIARGLMLGAAVTSLFCLVRSAEAANADFQNFFFDVCNSPTGALGTRCSETVSGLGDLSGDSESSLNPSQGLSYNDPALGASRSRSKQAREQGEKRRDEAEPSGNEVDIGPLSLLVNGRGSWFERERVVDVDAERGLEGEIWAAEIGLDYRLSSRAFLGALVSFERHDSEFVGENPGVNFSPASSAGDLNSDSYALTLFASLAPSDALFVEVNLGLVSSEYEVTRNSVFQESSRQVPQTNVRTRADTDGDGFWVGLNIGYDFGNGANTFGPYFGVTASSSTVDAYTETDLNNSGLGMSYTEIERESLIGHLGFRASRAVSTGRGVVLPQFRVEYEHEFDRDGSSLLASYVLDAANTQFALLGDEPNRDRFSIGGGLAAVFPNGWLPFIDVEVLLGDDKLDRYRVAAGFRLEF